MQLQRTLQWSLVEMFASCLKTPGWGWSTLGKSVTHVHTRMHVLVHTHAHVTSLSDCGDIIGNGNETNTLIN